jgi:fumarylacetoacetate (FAA) hydrolase
VKLDEHARLHVRDALPAARDELRTRPSISAHNAAVSQTTTSTLLDASGLKKADPAWGLDLEAEVGVIVGDVPSGAGIAQAAAAIRLIVILNDVSFRNLIPGELAKGFGFLQGKGQTAFAPVAATPDELGSAWDGAKLSGPLLSAVNGQPFGRPDAGVDMTFDFPTLIAHAAKTRPLLNGVIVGSGTVSNRDADGGPGKPIDEGGVGYSCIAEIRSVETIQTGAPKTPFLGYGDRVRIEMNDAEGRSIFGVIEQEVVR